MQDFISQNLTVIIIALAIIVTLILVIVYQSNKIQEISRPKYGFLGKPLSLVLVLALFGGGFVFVYNTTQKPPDVTISNANFEIELNIIATEINSINNLYRLNVVPVVDGVEWGVDGYQFTVYWTISNTTIQTDIETDLNSGYRGGIMKNLLTGTNQVKATIFVEDKKFEKVIEIVI